MSPTELPLARFLAHCHTDFSKDDSGEVASYIPELALADPNHFGIAATTVDGFVYEVGDSTVEFTIQSISKAFVFALALEAVGAEKVEAIVGVEPSGDAFNSIRLRADNRPFNPMVNAGAIACIGLICESDADGAFERRAQHARPLAGRRLEVDEPTFRSERETGDRNRAIAYLLRTHGILQGDVDKVLDVYFRQCSLRVSARDLSVMAATLANKGRNPLTGEQVASSYVVARTLSVMTSSGMYDLGGRLGLSRRHPRQERRRRRHRRGPSLAARPRHLFAAHRRPGNSIRGLRTCEALSTHFGLHMLNRVGDVQTCIAASYDVGSVSSRRTRPVREQAILEAHHEQCAILELTGALSFANVEYVSRRIGSLRQNLKYLILDFRRVPSVSEAALRLLADIFDDLASARVDMVFSGIPKGTPAEQSLRGWLADRPGVRSIATAGRGHRMGRGPHHPAPGRRSLSRKAGRHRRAGIAGRTGPDELADLTGSMVRREYRVGDRLISAGDPASSLMFVASGVVSVRLHSGVRLATLSSGMAVGEMALLETSRSADVWADTHVTCFELSLDAFNGFRDRYPHAGEKIMANLARLLAKRLIVANHKIEVLASY